MASSTKYSSPASLEERKEGVQLLPPPAPKRIRKNSTLPRSPSFILPPPSPPVVIPPPKSIVVPTNGVDLWHHFHRPHLDAPHHHGLPELQKKIGDTNFIRALGKDAYWDPNMKAYRLPGNWRYDIKASPLPPPPLEPIPEVQETCYVCGRLSTDLAFHGGFWFCDKDKEGCKRTFNARQAEMEAKKTNCVICGKKFGTGKQEEGEVCDRCVCVYRDS